MFKLSDLKPSPGSTKNRKRVGRGPGSGHGKQSTQGGKGQKGGSGYKSRAWSEGGQMPLQRRIPKRGFTNKFRVNYQEININAIAALDLPDVTVEILRKSGLATRKNMLIKVLGDGELLKPITIKAHAFSVSAKEKIEKAGGTAEIVK
ncbi:MAG TPA: 50S ribosomal protein L15 [candidate division Zixibacteria bacterium]|jgi:large subunit ribosomal protein L15|nr:50S ribosomal protein L15 [candidate division Zixibacteria bacterium]HBZ01587.1 50S ribosomal protein L15 [candidate division Zixibacteria bacterium]